MNLICHNTHCGYCKNEHCGNPMRAINALGMCTFVYAKNSALPRDHTNYDYSDCTIPDSIEEPQNLNNT